MANARLPVETETWKKGAAQFNMCGQFLGYPMHQVETTVKPGMASRLVKYASKRIIDFGFSLDLFEKCVVAYDETDDQYHVSFALPSGSEMVVNAIFTRSGWPFLDHGITASEA